MKRPEYEIGSIAYLRVNAERKGVVTGYLVRADNILTYLVSWDDPIDEKEHWACELCTEKPLDLPEQS